MKDQTIQTIGVVAKVLGNNQYLIDFEQEGQVRSLRCYLSGRMRQYMISIMVGDRVQVDIPHPFTTGRITYREK